ncbi:MAG: DedA family protein [bacterium]|jgi:membrane protein DedA with SNARE-associated domain|nr:DedA family protein [candidate division KSB1 bacterium]MDH7560414.1 DedA family protein [bacterium]
MTQAILQFGYPLVFIGVMLQGELPVLLGGFLIHQGYFDWVPLIFWASLATALGDQLYFSLARWQGRRWLARFFASSKKLCQAEEVIQRHGALIVLLMRFLYGLRPFLPGVLGLSRVGFWQFTLLNSVGACLWAGLFAAIGYVVGDGASLVAANLRALERGILFGTISLSLILALVRWCRPWSQAGKGPAGGKPKDAHR